MQDLRSITSGGVAGGGGGGGAGGGSSRIFGGGDRRLRPYPNQPLKCPRCDSLNTKFCYYNNYNLSQPRHFCKSCRRYWTKGGVLRNVPVGGGCRKTKRSNKPKQTSAEVHKERKPTTTSHSSSDSSGLTAATTASTNPCTTEVATSGSSATTGGLATCFPDSTLLVSQSPNPNLEQPSVLENLEKASSDSGGVFTGFMAAAPNPGLVGYNFSSANQLHISPFRLNQHHDQEKQQYHQHQHQQHQQQQMEDIHDQLQEQEKIMMIEELKMQELTVGCVDQTATPAAAMELSMPGAFQKRMNSNGELTVSEWQLGSGDHCPLFDLPSTVDQEYWSQSQWPDQDQDHDHHMYLP